LNLYQSHRAEADVYGTELGTTGVGLTHLTIRLLYGSTVLRYCKFFSSNRIFVFEVQMLILARCPQIDENLLNVIRDRAPLAPPHKIALLPVITSSDSQMATFSFTTKSRCSSEVAAPLSRPAHLADVLTEQLTLCETALHSGLKDQFTWCQPLIIVHYCLWTPLP